MTSLLAQAAFPSKGISLVANLIKLNNVAEILLI